MAIETIASISENPFGASAFRRVGVVNVKYFQKRVRFLSPYSDASSQGMLACWNSSTSYPRILKLSIFLTLISHVSLITSIFGVHLAIVVGVNLLKGPLCVWILDDFVLKKWFPLLQRRTCGTRRPLLTTETPERPV